MDLDDFNRNSWLTSVSTQDLMQEYSQDNYWTL